jgi:hypothetical protein
MVWLVNISYDIDVDNIDYVARVTFVGDLVLLKYLICANIDSMNTAIVFHMLSFYRANQVFQVLEFLF